MHIMFSWQARSLIFTFQYKESSINYFYNQGQLVAHNLASKYPLDKTSIQQVIIFAIARLLNLYPLDGDLEQCFNDCRKPNTKVLLYELLF